jgi:hypothetical protein
MGKQPFLDSEHVSIGVPRITSGSGSRYNAVTGNNDRYRVITTRVADGAWRCGKPVGKFSVGTYPARGDVTQCFPDLSLEVRALRSQRYGKCRPGVGKIVLQLTYYPATGCACEFPVPGSNGNKPQLRQRIPCEANGQFDVTERKLHHGDFFMCHDLLLPGFTAISLPCLPILVHPQRSGNQQYKKTGDMSP